MENLWTNTWPLFVIMWEWLKGFKSSMIHTTIVPNIEKGETNWLESATG